MNGPSAHPESILMKLPRRPLDTDEVLNSSDRSCPVCAQERLTIRLLPTRRSGNVGRMLQALCQLCGSIGQQDLED